MIDREEFAGAGEDFTVSPEIKKLDVAKGAQAFLNGIVSSEEHFRERFTADVYNNLNKVGKRAKRPLPLLLFREWYERFCHSGTYRPERLRLLEIDTEKNYIQPRFYDLAQTIALFSMRLFGLRDEKYSESMPIEVEGMEILTIRRLPSQTISRLEFVRQKYVNPTSGKVTYLSWDAEEVKRERIIFGFRTYL